MKFKDTFRRELQVAFSTRSQSIAFRISKYAVLAVLGYFIWGTGYFWPVVAVLLIGAITLHFWFRHKTKGWTQSWGPWKYHD